MDVQLAGKDLNPCALPPFEKGWRKLLLRTIIEMKERLQKIISSAGLASRRTAEKYILQGRVAVNGKTAELGQKADPDTDCITIDSRPITSQPEKIYIALNKPRGYTTTLKDERGRKTVAELTQDIGTRLYPVGRLDINSEGLLVMTNHGDAAYRLAHPKYEVEKTYHVTVSLIDKTEGTEERIKKAIETMSKEMVIDGCPIKPARVSMIDGSGEKCKLSVIISQGRNRQIRKMCSVCGLHVHRLLRISQGCIELGDLRAGRWRYLTESELEFLQKLLQK